jgi:uncharacterized protein
VVANAVELDRIIDDFRERVSEGLTIEALVLYGSYACGVPNDDSDIDLAIVSPDFEGVGMSRRQEILAHLAFDADARISPIGYPSSAYHSPGPHSFVREIINTGRVVYRGSAHN